VREADRSLDHPEREKNMVWIGRLGVPVLLAVAAACGGEQASPPPVTEGAPGTQAAPGLEGEAAMVLNVAPEGNEVRYRVRERLVGRDRDNDAVGVTDRVTGSIGLAVDGTIVEGSLVRVDVSQLRSDEDRRDGYVRNRLLEADQHPTVEFRPREARGLAHPTPRTGSQNFELIGDLTVRGETRPSTWRVNATFDQNRVTGTAATAFTFSDHGLTQPRVPVVLSVADTIRLEYDFNWIAATD
jgi:polyisoprenoid-binding protein YceI